MQATLGYQPAHLPDLGKGDAYCDDNTDIHDNATRHCHRLREIAVQSMISATAADRATRALRSKTRQAVQ
eukprot:8597099-Prorocentrum_lima.AAC.1